MKGWELDMPNLLEANGDFARAVGWEKAYISCYEMRHQSTFVKVVWRSVDMVGYIIQGWFGIVWAEAGMVIGCIYASRETSRSTKKVPYLFSSRTMNRNIDETRSWTAEI